jgi:hypothetical protein
MNMNWKEFVTRWANQEYQSLSLELSEKLTKEELESLLRVYPDFLEENTYEDAAKAYASRSTVRDRITQVCNKCNIYGLGSKDELLKQLRIKFHEVSTAITYEDLDSNINDLSKIDIEKASNLEFPEGVMPLNSKFYMEPISALQQCQEAIIHPNALLRIQAPRQMGKTSLLERIVNYAEGLNYRIARIDLREADLATLEDLDLLLQWFCQEVCDRLDLPIVVAENWQNGGGSKSACVKFFEKHLLHTANQPLLLSLDNLDQIFINPLVGDDFASLIRAWHDKTNNTWRQQLRIIILYIWYVEPTVANHSPFNVGCPIDLPELTIDLVGKLVTLYGLEWSKGEIQQLTDLVGFHPFLIRLALYHVATKKTSLAEILDRGHLADSLFNGHLMSHLRYLERQPEELRQIMAQVVNSESPPTIVSSLLQRLNDAGLVKLDGDRVLPANKLYQLYFSTRL